MSNNNKKEHIKFDPNNESHIKVGMIVSFLLIIAIFIYGVTLFIKKDEYKDIKENSSKEIVYTSYYNEEFEQSIPYVNLKAKIFEQLNDEIEENVKNYKDNETCKINYQYNINGIVLSLIISIVDTSSDMPEVSFISYNINLDREEVISDSALLDYFGITEEDASNIVNEKFKEHYNKEVKKGYIVKQECDFNCYLELRDKKALSPENYSYYVENGKLYAYVPFDIYSIYAEEEYFKDADFKFYLADTPEE